MNTFARERSMAMNWKNVSVFTTKGNKDLKNVRSIT